MSAILSLVPSPISCLAHAEITSLRNARAHQLIGKRIWCSCRMSTCTVTSPGLPRAVEDVAEPEGNVDAGGNGRAELQRETDIQDYEGSGGGDGALADGCP
jgi:hypothetical protein